MKNILITGVGGPTPIGIAKSLLLGDDKNSFRLIGVDADPLAPGLYNHTLFDKTYRIPNAKTDTTTYWNKIDEIVKKEQIDFAFVVPETEVLMWSLKQKEEKLPCRSVIPEYEVAVALYNKLTVSQLLDQSGLTPPTFEIANLEEGKKLEEQLTYPYWIRIKSGAGAIGALKINSLVDIENWFSINKTGTTFIASPFLPGGNYACKLLYKDGALISSASAERIGYLLSAAAPSGISGMCAHGRLINDPDLVDRSSKALEIIYKHYNKTINGMFTVDFKESEDGIPLITEINIRHVSFTYAFALGGANFSLDTIETFLDGKLLNNKGFLFKKNYRFIRGVDAELFTIEDSKII